METTTHTESSLGIKAAAWVKVVLYPGCEFGESSASGYYYLSALGNDFVILASRSRHLGKERVFGAEPEKCRQR
jgi:hypothetical protein